MDLIVVDLEATCWAESRPRDLMEIIEIGAVRLNGDLEVVDEFSAFVRPVVETSLSDNIAKIAKIAQLLFADRPPAQT